MKKCPFVIGIVFINNAFLKGWAQFWKEMGYTAAYGKIGSNGSQRTKYHCQSNHLLTDSPVKALHMFFSQFKIEAC